MFDFLKSKNPPDPEPIKNENYNPFEHRTIAHPTS